MHYTTDLLHKPHFTNISQNTQSTYNGCGDVSLPELGASPTGDA